MCQTLVQLAQLDIRTYVQHVVGSSNLPRARNELAAGFLASDYTDLLFIDDDMGWQPADVVRLLASDKPLIAGVGPKKRALPDNDARKWCVRFLADNVVNQDRMGAVEVEAVGTGFMLISRSVFTTMIEAHPEWKRRGWDNMPEDARRWYHRFFHFDSDHADEPGEDYSFCWAWRALGGQVWSIQAFRWCTSANTNSAGTSPPCSSRRRSNAHTRDVDARHAAVPERR